MSSNFHHHHHSASSTSYQDTLPPPGTYGGTGAGSSHEPANYSTGSGSTMGDTYSSFETLHTSTSALSSFQESLTGIGGGSSSYSATPGASDSGFTTIQGTYTMFPQQHREATPTSSAAGSTPGPAGPADKPEYYRSDPSPTPSGSSQSEKFSSSIQGQFSEPGFSSSFPPGGSSSSEGTTAGYIDSPEYFQKPPGYQPPPQQTGGFHPPTPSSFPDQKDSVFAGHFTQSMFPEARAPFQGYQGSFFDAPPRMEGNFTQAGPMYRGDFNIHIGRQPYPRNLSLSIGAPLGPEA